MLIQWLNRTMDNLTHTAIGVFLARAGLGRLSPRATAIVVLAANLPDIDLVTWAGGSSAYLSFHRHLTHSILLAPLVALASVALVRLMGRKPVSWIGGMAAALIGVASHLALDWTNVYGIRLLLPFSERWLSGDATSVLDPWILAIAALGFAVPFLSRMVGSEIASGAVKEKHHGRGSAILALLMVLVYDGGRVLLHDRAVASLTTRLYEGAVPVRALAIPDPTNPFAWHGIVETEQAYFVQEVNLASAGPLARGTVMHKPLPDPAFDAARKTQAFERFFGFARYPMWRVTPDPQVENGTVVEAFDLRFGTPQAPRFVARAVVDGRLNVVDSRFSFGEFRPR
jgi:inner membrane protein